jgi:hypothetical protein
MNIAIDYDHTYSADPPMWDQVIGIFKSAGHSVFCVTNRALPHVELDQAMAALQVPTVYAGERYKNDAIREELDIHVNIWIDDMPGTITPSLLLP